MTPLFVSGWAGCECIYPQLARDCRMLIPFLRHEEPEIARILHQGGSTLLGWSTGAHMILKLFPDILRKFERIILAGPFLSFTRYVPKARLEAMIRAMTRTRSAPWPASWPSADTAARSRSAAPTIRLWCAA
jgi:hypothetical protein